MSATLRPPLFFAAALTAIVTVVRLVGERAGGPAWVFGREAGGGAALVGIGWLIPVFGAWFGHRLARAGDGPADLRRALQLVFGALLGVVVVFLVAKVLLPVTLATFVFVALALPALAILAVLAWPALARALFVYAVLARAPVIALTVVAVRSVWGTHFEQLAPGAPPMTDFGRTVVLCCAQVCLWIPLTMLVGALAGLLAAMRVQR
ncbi:MAG: hypothetical protein JNK15_11650 [Planctomycetes bacterium]|nr:hypothetical protein [Planctomycetota bacterium]